MRSGAAGPPILATSQAALAPRRWATEGPSRPPAPGGAKPARGRPGPSDGALREALELETDAGALKKGDDPAADVRTLRVDYDNQGERYKSWRDVTRESTQETFPDTPLEGPGATSWPNTSTATGRIPGSGSLCG